MIRVRAAAGRSIRSVMEPLSSFFPSLEGKCRGFRGEGVSYCMKTKISNLSSLKDNRRKLRNESTPQEIMLWARLRKEQLGHKFRRQHSFGNYIADFYCPDKKLIVEIDGSQHLDQEAYDTERTTFFGKQGFRVVRFWNSEINTNMEGVITKIIGLLE